jgi:hypothetical protein
MTGLIQIKQLARMLSLGQLRKLEEWMHEFIRKLEEKALTERQPSGQQIVEEQTHKKTTYRLEGIRCGKENCKCAVGNLHGPYWYSYSRVDGKVKSQYVGNKLPREVQRTKLK